MRWQGYIVMFQHGSAHIKARALEAIVQAMDKIYAMVIAASEFALLLPFFLKREELFMAPAAALYVQKQVVVGWSLGSLVVKLLS